MKRKSSSPIIKKVVVRMARKISPYAQELFESGRGEELLRQFCRKLIILKRIPDYRRPHRDLRAKHREKVKHDKDT